MNYKPEDANSSESPGQELPGVNVSGVDSAHAENGSDRAVDGTWTAIRQRLQQRQIPRLPRLVWVAVACLMVSCFALAGGARGGTMGQRFESVSRSARALFGGEAPAPRRLSSDRTADEIQPVRPARAPAKPAAPVVKTKKKVDLATALPTPTPEPCPEGQVRDANGDCGPPPEEPTPTTTPTPITRPDNDDFENAHVLAPVAGGTMNGNNVNATKQTGEPVHAADVLKD